ncbi:MAG: glycosyltransferase [Bacteroidia bacterium]|nr:glycosyltransferase [Bacteroidia bacterium]
MSHIIHDLKGVLFLLLLVTTVTQLVYYWFFFRRLAFYKYDQVTGGPHPVSVIVCAKNEVLRLQKYLPAVLEQAYPDFEVIVINDCSWDETGEYLESIAQQYPQLKIVTIKEQEKYRHGKKFALTLGIKAAKNEYLLFTDADCIPAGKNWLSLMQRHFARNTEIILGYGPYQKEPGFLNKLIRYDTFHIATQYLSAALGKNPYMGVGRNLAYKKDLFFRTKGFAKHNHILSGDDDLFVNENGNSQNTAVELDPESFTYSEAKKTFGQWFAQKKRHMSTARHYKSGHQFFLLMNSGSLILFYLLLITLLILRFEWRILVSLYAGLIVLRLPIVFSCAKRLKENDLVWTFPFLEIVHIMLQPLFYIANVFSKQKSWK